MSQCDNGCQYAKDVGMENHSCANRCMYAESKYLLTMEGNTESFEVPVFARSLEEATLQAEHYEEAGFVVTRIRPAVAH
ncbi:RNA polymerase inhibitor [Klebsiella phage vB_Kpn_K10PH82C1]|uniref:RNA polymerase inhibitor n=2 Tax=Benllochvirus TaxID=3424954 RepID=A0AAD2Q0A7_9CAUD|nr:RNA polymerase inhibitor [Klebsiella phage VLCpiA3a]WQZ00607.1 bacterial RNA polymerase inhibitor [Klebsiella phage vB_KpnP_cmc355D]CAK1344548.1 RNA polymerase inhibitor [Klebsiella phage vB_Kpn_K10PH82C1]